MQWRGRRESTNVEDRRGMSGKGLAVGGGLGGIVLLVLYLIMGGNPGDMSSQLTPQQPQQEMSAEEQKLDETCLHHLIARNQYGKDKKEIK